MNNRYCKSAVLASAPGKIVLCGEYAVLDGAPAIVTAVDCRARVSARKIDGPDHQLVAPGMINDKLRFRRETDGNFSWSAGRYRLVEEIFETLGKTRMPPLALHLDTREFRDPASGKKLGFGSSAALSAALVAALDKLFDMQLDVVAVASRAHRAYQSGQGSGVDIAASINGGTLQFQNDPTRDDGRAVVHKLDWPQDLEYRILWSGRPANTARKLRQLDARRTAGARSVAALAEAARRVANVWQGTSVELLLDGLRDYVAALVQFSAEHQLGVFDAGHAGLVDFAASQDVVYKPCGAGGGDVGVAFGSSVPELNAFCDQAARAGFTRIDMSIGAPGVLIEKRNEP
jgi:phosphomevalonate kinase